MLLQAIGAVFLQDKEGRIEGPATHSNLDGKSETLTMIIFLTTTCRTSVGNNERYEKNAKESG